MKEKHAFNFMRQFEETLLTTLRAKLKDLSSYEDIDHGIKKPISLSDQSVSCLYKDNLRAPIRAFGRSTQ